MENKINLVEILRHCPPGMELDCILFQNLEFDRIIDSTIRCRIKNSNGGYYFYYFTEYGCWLNVINDKCVIFPKGKTTWEGFVPPYKFKDGDIITNIAGDVFIYKETITCSFCGSFASLNHYNHFIPFYQSYLTDNIRFATEEEKQKLFNKIKEHGYKWNAETKTLDRLIVPKFKIGDKIKNKISNKTFIITNKDSLSYYIDNSHFSIWIENQDNYELVLDKIEPKFKVGDVVQDKDGYKVEITDVSIDDESYKYTSKLLNGIGAIDFKDQDEWELVLVKIFVPKFKVGDRVVRKCGIRVPLLITKVGEEFYYSNNEDIVKFFSIKDQDEWELVPNKFDISTLEPFESRVLVRDFEDQSWKPAIWGYYDINSCNRSLYRVLGGNGFLTCIPYEGNEHLRGKTDDCDNYYKTWED